MRELPIPAHFDPARVGEVWRVPYEERAREATAWAEQHGIRRAAEDPFRICLLAVDVQNTFCVPDFELFVAGRSGTGAVDDNRRLCEFVYRNLGTITQVFPSLDTHHAMQIFHAIWLVDEDRQPPRALHAGLARGRRGRPLEGERGGGRGARARSRLRRAPPRPLHPSSSPPAASTT